MRPFTGFKRAGQLYFDNDLSFAGEFDGIRDQIRKRLRSQASPRHVPARIIEVSDIPRTRSGKIVEVAVREVIHGRAVANVEAIANPDALELYRDLPELRS